MHVLVIAKAQMSCGEFNGVKSITYNSATQVYTLTLSDDSTQTYSRATYYITLLWS